jgi:mono/diheme cytochrome c family protein
MARFSLLSFTMILAAASLAACQTPPQGEEPAAFPDAVLPGERIAEFYCSSCHAIGRRDSSAHPEAPAFRSLSQLYPVRALEEALAEGIAVGHPDMPPFQLEPDDIDALLSYLESIQDPA